MMACLLPFSLRMLKRANKTALLRMPEHLVSANLKAPLPIRHIADFGLQARGAKFNGTVRRADGGLIAASEVRYFRPSGSEEQKALVELSDIVVDGPAGVLALLRQFARDAAAGHAPAD